MSNATIISNGSVSTSLSSVSSNLSLINVIDPNWFYSAIAQSSAAIVGIIGAFLTTKLINQKSLIKKTETEIKDNEAKIDFLKEKIREKEEWINQIDEEEDLKDVKDFLDDIKDRINPDNPPTIDELIQMGNESENDDFHNLNRDILESSFNEDYFEEVRADRSRRSMPFGLGNITLPNIAIPISPEITGRKWDRYRRYSDEIYSTKTEIEYLKKLNETKNKELANYKSSIDLKQTFIYLVVFSFVGVFLPLFMLTQKPAFMDTYKLHTLLVVLLSWVALLYHFIKEISILSISKKKTPQHDP